MTDRIKAATAQDGKAFLFHFADGWIRRHSVDAREIVMLGHGTTEPTPEQFEKLRAALPATMSQDHRARALRWPTADGSVPPPWYAEAVKDEPWAQGALAVQAPIDPRDLIIAELRAKLAVAEAAKNSDFQLPLDGAEAPPAATAPAAG